MNLYDQKMARIKQYEMLTYKGNDLGMTRDGDLYTFKVWSPLAKNVYFNLYESGDINDRRLKKQIPMTKNEENVWELTLKAPLDGLFYTYIFQHDDPKYSETESPDLYSAAVGINGDRTAIIDWESTHPDQWEDDRHVYPEKSTDAIIWEVHVRDFSEDVRGGFRVEDQGKYMAFTDPNTSLYHAKDFPTGIAYLKKLGVNMVHLLPVFDHDNDELSDTYNWGYNPKNYMVPEGQYASDPADPIARIREFKSMVQALHQAGIGVIMDVVYNHTYKTEDSWLQLTAPDYYYRFNPDGNFANGSGVGNEIASERTMMRQYMIDTLLFWAKEYHIDGFRFDLMGLHDVDTMNAIRQAFDDHGLSQTLLYGEPWNGGGLALKNAMPADKFHVGSFSERIAIFNDEFRDAIKGQVFDPRDGAFLQGRNQPRNSSFKDQDLIAAYIGNPMNGAQTNLQRHQKWARSPKEVVNYASAHDNLTLYDKLVLASGYDPDYERHEELILRNKISAMLLMTAQGIILMQAGEEFGRTKFGDENSYNAPLAINKLDWTRSRSNIDLLNYYRGMIKIRKAYAPLRDDTDMTSQAIRSQSLPENSIFIHIPNLIESDPNYKEMLVMANTGYGPLDIDLDQFSDQNQIGKAWQILASPDSADDQPQGQMTGNKLALNPLDFFVLVR